jgi:hypothetical protein
VALFDGCLAAIINSNSARKVVFLSMIRVSICSSIWVSIIVVITMMGMTAAQNDPVEMTKYMFNDGMVRCCVGFSTTCTCTRSTILHHLTSPHLTSSLVAAPHLCDDER